jgi:hypothetical protein
MSRAPPEGGSIMRDTRTIDRQPWQDRPYTPTPEGFERRLRAWVRLPESEVTDCMDANAPPDEPDAS